MPPKPCRRRCFRRGLLTLTCGERSLRLAPPLVVTIEQADTAVSILGDAVASVRDALEIDDMLPDALPIIAVVDRTTSSSKPSASPTATATCRPARRSPAARSAPPVRPPTSTPPWRPPRRLRRSGARRRPRRAGALVRRLGELLREHKAELGELVSIEAGKIRSEGLGEVQEMIDICDFAVGLSRQLHGLTIASERPGHRLMETWHPMGPCAVITAFNFPVAVWSWNAALALVAGDPVLWKPSDKTPLTALACDALFATGRRRASVHHGASTRCSRAVPTSAPPSPPTPTSPSCRRPGRRGWAGPWRRSSPAGSGG